MKKCSEIGGIACTAILSDSVLSLKKIQEERTLCVLEVMPPQWTDLILASNVPHCKADVLVLHCLHVET